MATRSKLPLHADRRADGRWKRRPAILPVRSESIDAGAAFCFGDGRTSGMLAGRKDTTRKLYRDAYEGFRRFLADVHIDPSVDGWQRLPPNALAAFYRWGLDHRRGGLTDRTASSYAYALSALLRQLLIEERCPRRSPWKSCGSACAIRWRVVTTSGAKSTRASRRSWPG